MKIHDLKRRLHSDRPMTSISIRFPEDVVDDLKRVAPVLGFGGYQPLIRAYVGQGLRKDLERLEPLANLESFVEGLRRRGVDTATIDEALEESRREAS